MAVISPTPAEVINRAIDIFSGRIRVGMPGIVQSYNATTQTADVLPAPMPSITLEDGSETTEAYPVLQHVPVHFPSGGKYRITFPIQKGDSCWLMFADHSIDVWQSQGGQYAPLWLQEHDLSDAVCMVGFKPDPAAWKDAPTTELTLGKDGGLTIRVGETTIDLGGGSTDFVAMAAKVLTALQDIATKFNAHTHLSASPGSPTGTAAASTPPITITAPSSVASSTVKVKD